MKFLYILSLILLLIVTLSNPSGVRAIVDPASTTNNRFGIHIVETADLEDAAKLVNSGGGDWGYVTLVIGENDRNPDRWQKEFDRMRRLHLIPIVRVATKMQDGFWTKPNTEEIETWIKFFESLNWVIQNRYLIIGNEPNHAKEWGGELKPEEYAEYFFNFATRLKQTSGDYFILPAGFDASAPNGRNTMDQQIYMQRMVKKVPDIFKLADGWNSHSYPNPAFAGPADGNGRGSVRTYLWELNLLKSYKLEKELPVFITETGWAHDRDGAGTSNIETVLMEQNFRTAFENAWNDNRVVAVTPFLLNYQNEPFDSFSWKKPDGNYYDFYYKLQELAKASGTPAQINKAEILSIYSPQFTEFGNSFIATLLLKNNGQSILEAKDLKLISDSVGTPTANIVAPNQIEPGHTGLIVFSGDKPLVSQAVSDISIVKDNENITPEFNFSTRAYSTHPLITLIDLKDIFFVAFRSKYSPGS